MAGRNVSKRFFTVSVTVIALLIVIAFVGIFSSRLSQRGKEDYMVASDGSYVICDGERYVPTGEGFSADTPTDRIIAENVSIENGDLLDRFFIYGYMIYGSAEDDSVIYVHTAESSGVSWYYVKELLKDDIPQKAE